MTDNPNDNMNKYPNLNENALPLTKDQWDEAWGSRRIPPMIIPKDKPKDEALLGLATTEQLIRELIARWTVPLDLRNIDRAILIAEILGGLTPDERRYRTADK